MRPGRPPAEITAERFFQEWLPSEFAREFGPGRRVASDITVAVNLEGDGGGRWILDVAGGRIAIRPPGAAGPEPMVTLWQPVRDWRAVVCGEAGPPGSIDLAPPHTSPLDVLFVDPASRQIMAAVRGTVRFEVTAYHGRTWWMQVKFGQQPASLEPDATLSVDAETYGRVLARELTPPEAYFAGLIGIRGDTALAMQLGMSLLPQLTRGESRR